LVTPNSPEGYTPYEQYSLPRFAQWIFLGLIGSMFLLLTLEYGLQFGHPDYRLLIVGIGIGLAGTLFLHESLHFIADRALGYNPVYIWPSSVYIPDEDVETWESIVGLLAPQLLTIIYIPLLLTGDLGDMEHLLVWGLLMHSLGSYSDLLWIFRLLLWPDDTMVTVGEDLENYVAFPTDEGESLL
jgi:hypothetical protein